MKNVGKGFLKHDASAILHLHARGFMGFSHIRERQPATRGRAVRRVHRTDDNVTGVRKRGIVRCCTVWIESQRGGASNAEQVRSRREQKARRKWVE